MAIHTLNEVPQGPEHASAFGVPDEITYLVSEACCELGELCDLLAKHFDGEQDFMRRGMAQRISSLGDFMYAITCLRSDLIGAAGRRTYGRSFELPIKGTA